MGERIEGRGRCLCGAVQLTAQQVHHKQVGACHCKMCRQWGGGPLLAVDCGTEVTFVGEEHIGLFSSSQWAERGFCKQCGSHLFYRLKDNQQHMIPAGLFDIEPKFTLEHQVFIDEKPEFYAFANETEDMTGAEVFAQYGPPPG